MEKQFLQYIGDHIVRLSTNLEEENKQLKKIIKSLVRTGALGNNNIIPTFYWTYKDFKNMKCDHKVYLVKDYYKKATYIKATITKTSNNKIIVNFDDNSNEEYNVLVRINNSKWIYLDKIDPSIHENNVLGFGQMSGLAYYRCG